MINRAKKGDGIFPGVDFEPRISRQLFQCQLFQPAASTRCGVKPRRGLMGRRCFECTPSFPDGLCVASSLGSSSAPETTT